jgi:hypothetical protein
MSCMRRRKQTGMRDQTPISMQECVERPPRDFGSPCARRALYPAYQRSSMEINVIYAGEVI